MKTHEGTPQTRPPELMGMEQHIISENTSKEGTHFLMIKHPWVWELASGTIRWGLHGSVFTWRCEWHVNEKCVVTPFALLSQPTVMHFVFKGDVVTWSPFKGGELTPGRKHKVTEAIKAEAHLWGDKLKRMGCPPATIQRYLREIIDHDVTDAIYKEALRKSGLMEQLESEKRKNKIL